VLQRPTTIRLLPEPSGIVTYKFHNGRDTLVLTTHIGLRTTSFAYGCFVLVVALGTLAFERVTVRHEQVAV
jgi:hypothetical protein